MLSFDGGGSGRIEGPRLGVQGGNWYGVWTQGLGFAASRLGFRYRAVRQGVSGNIVHGSERSRTS